MKIGKIKIGKVWLAVIIIIILIAGYYTVKSILKDPFEAYALEKASVGEVLQEVSETGSVRATEEVSLSFKTVGKVSSINVVVGNDVKKGQVLAGLDSGQISAQLQSAKAALSVAATQYEKLLNGSTAGDIKIYQNAVDSAKDDLQSDYTDALNTLHDTYNKIYNAYTVVVSVQSDYFYSSDQQGVKVLEARDNINRNMQATKALVDKAEDSKTRENIDSAILNMTITLNSVYNDLKIVRDQCDQGTYFLSVSSTDKTSLDTQKTYINTALTSVTTAQQTISADKIALQKAEDNLAVEVAAPRPEDIDIYKSQIEQAQANVNSYQSQLNDNFIYSPIDGKVTAVNAKRGETVSYSESIINLLSTEPFQVKVDVYEQDIVNVDTGDPVKIDLVAFPKQTFEGKVLSIDPAEKIVDNVIYYQVTIEFPNQPAGVRSGMTADITIETDKKAGVLRVSKNAVQNIDGKYIVQVAESRKIIDKEVVIGLEGNDYYEIISGIKEGEMIVAGKK